ncbi:MAG TPA: aminoacyl-tRNA hydrolase, partial [Syntrophomonas wolfei]|nr:aminoacyl-tRNA hydrolase [Syntrophomonas wolfei]
PPGAVRIRASGGSGGHKGMQSICESLGSRDFPRIRIGIGRPPGGAIDWVLGEFSESEKPLMQDAVEKAASAIECWIKSGIDACMNAYN